MANMIYFINIVTTDNKNSIFLQSKGFIKIKALKLSSSQERKYFLCVMSYVLSWLFEMFYANFIDLTLFSKANARKIKVLL